MDEPVSVLKLSGFLARYSDLWTQRCAEGSVQLKLVLYRHGAQRNLQLDGTCRLVLRGNTG